MTDLAARLAVDTLILVRMPSENREEKSILGEIRSRLALAPGLNLGPGDPRYAHTDDEQVGAAALARTYDIMSAFLAEEA
jgi:acetylornithine deacetylase/succinyl-diaminopimelate desuccinylase-like protein